MICHTRASLSRTSLVFDSCSCFVTSNQVQRCICKFSEDIQEFKFLKPKAKGNASTSTASCDDTSVDFPDDDDNTNDDDTTDEDYANLKVKKARTFKGKSSKSKGSKTRALSCFKSKVVSKGKTMKSPLDSSDEDIPKSTNSKGKTVTSPLDSSDEDILKSSKSRAKTSKGKAIKNCIIRLAKKRTWDLIQKNKFGARKPTFMSVLAVAEGRKGKMKVGV
ncbi:hypothetical protein Tco_0366943 [Tanacetum coccineum]